MNLLDGLAIKHGTDKVPGKLIIKWGQNYTQIYHKFLNERRFDIKKVMEIGIGFPEAMTPVPNYKAGASLRMWEEYFPNAAIYAIDVKEEILINEGRIKSFVCDQCSEESLKELIEKIGDGFDLIIDDGCHEYDCQIKTVKSLMGILKDDGLFFMEDVADYQKIVKALEQYIYAIFLPNQYLAATNNLLLFKKGLR